MKKLIFAKNNQHIMKIKYLIALACITVALFGCKKGDKSFHGTLPTSITIEKVDLTGAAALAVMPYSAAPSVKTRAGEEEYGDRLFIVDRDGNTKLASFTIKDSKYNNTIWKEIRKTLTIVPASIIPLSEDLILFGDSYEATNYIEWQKDASSQEEIDAICDLLTSLSGPYILRVSDGALFRSPFVVIGNGEPGRAPVSSLSNVMKPTSDSKTFIIEPSYDYFLEFDPGFALRSYEIFGLGRMGFDMPLGPWILSDKGDYFEMKHPLEYIQTCGPVFGFMVTQDDRIIEFGSGNGSFSYDFDLNPLYVDYSPDVQEVFSHGFLDDGNGVPTPTFDFGGDTYVIIKKKGNPSDILVYKIYLTDNELNCSLVCSGLRYDALLFRYKAYSTNNGIGMLVRGAKLVIDVVNGTCDIEAIPDDFPQEWKAYDENGVAYEMAENEIIKYDINSKVKTSIPIHWEQVDFGGFAGGFVPAAAFYCNGVFTYSGRTRTGQSVTVLIDAETGNVSLTDLAEYSGSVVKTYYRLN